MYADIELLKRSTHYFQGFYEFHPGQTVANIACNSEVLCIFLESVNTARLSGDTCRKLFNQPQLLADCLVFADRYLAEEFSIYLRFLLTWRVLSHPPNPETLFTLYSHIDDPITKTVAEAFLCLSMSRTEFRDLAENHREIGSRVEYLDRDNLFVTRYNTHFDLSWDLS
jgi:hypothetical protein